MTATTPSWALLIVTLPTSGATARMRIWRAIKSMGCAALRDGAYLLPGGVEQVGQLHQLADETRQENGQAWLLQVSAGNPDDEIALRALFDRGADYDELQTALAEALEALSDQNGAELNRLLRRHERAYEAIRRIDFFPNEASRRAEAGWNDFSRAVEAIQSPGEPQPLTRTIPRRDAAQYQGRRWATRRHLWADRVSSAWLIRRFIDPHARFLWLESPADCPDDALGFDFDGATFTHVGDRVSFEVLLASFGLEANRGLSRLARVVHALDIGGISAPEASGFEAVLAGARARLQDDDALLAEISSVLDSLYAHFSANNRP